MKNVLADERTFLSTMRDAAAAAGHTWPEYAACETALESGWGHSRLARLAFNMFGRKQSHYAPRFETITLPTTEILHGHPETVSADWVKYPDLASCFRDRMELLNRLRNRYRDALDATSGEAFINAVSRRWSTDPNRANRVLAIYKAHASSLGWDANSASVQGDGDGE